MNVSISRLWWTLQNPNVYVATHQGAKKYLRVHIHWWLGRCHCLKSRKFPKSFKIVPKSHGTYGNAKTKNSASKWPNIAQHDGQCIRVGDRKQNRLQKTIELRNQNSALQSMLNFTFIAEMESASVLIESPRQNSQNFQNLPQEPWHPWDCKYQNLATTWPKIAQHDG